MNSYSPVDLDLRYPTSSIPIPSIKNQKSTKISKPKKQRKRVKNRSKKSKKRAKDGMRATTLPKKMP